MHCWFEGQAGQMGAAGHWMQFADALEVDTGADEVPLAEMH
jgi:hypothetical protein